MVHWLGRSHRRCLHHLVVKHLLLHHQLRGQRHCRRHQTRLKHCLGRWHLARLLCQEHLLLLLLLV